MYFVQNNNTNSMHLAHVHNCGYSLIQTHNVPGIEMAQWVFSFWEVLTPPSYHVSLRQNKLSVSIEA